jgi:kynurenine formamidase
MLNHSFLLLDLSHPIEPGMPVWPGDPEIVIERHAELERDGFDLNRLVLGEHTGTHLGAPRHLISTASDVASIPVDQLLCPVCRIDQTRQCEQDSDHRVTVSTIVSWERQHARIMSGSIVVIHTGWSDRWPDAQRYFGTDDHGGLHFPGIRPEAVRFLLEDRRVVAVGIDTPGIDGGQSTTLDSNRLLAAAGCYHLENLNGLGRLPETGAMLLVAPLAIRGGTGSPCRVLALVPRL